MKNSILQSVVFITVVEKQNTYAKRITEVRNYIVVLSRDTFVDSGMGLDMKLMLPFKTEWEQEPSLRTAFGLESLSAPIVSVVGAGGKTTTIEQLVKEYEAYGEKIIVTTTTKMYHPSKWAWCKEANMEYVDNYLQKEAVLWIGVPYGEEKMSSPSVAFLAQLEKKGLPMLIEADGSRRLPFKLSGDMEPVILEGSQKVIGVLGMEALNRTFTEACFRPELAAKYLHKAQEDPITEEDYVEVIRNSFGLKKGIKDNMEYLVVLNQTDNMQRQKKALYIREMLYRQGIEKVFLTSYR